MPDDDVSVSLAWRILQDAWGGCAESVCVPRDLVDMLIRHLLEQS